jgi:hypothetical protein
MVLRIRDIQHLLGIDRDPLWGIELAGLIAKASQEHHGVTVLIKRLNAMIAGIGDIKQVIRPPGQTLWAHQCPPLRPLDAESLKEATIWREHLDAMIVGIGDVDLTSLVDHDAAGLPELADLPPFSPDSDGSSIGTGFSSGQEGTGAQEDKGEKATEETRDAATTEARHGLIHHPEQGEAQRSNCERTGLGNTNRRYPFPSGKGAT